jgi:hypothetical protein
VTASTEDAKAYLGDPTPPDAPHYLKVWAKYTPIVTSPTSARRSSPAPDHPI